MAELLTEPINTAPVASTPTPASTLAPVSPSAVYSPVNVSQIDLPSQSSASSMKLADLENKLSGAKSQTELNQIEIMNQPKAMGVLTGEAAYQSRLDTARYNAFNNLYQNRLLEEQRKEEQKRYEQSLKDAKSSEFMQLYGADPSQRPKGMSKSEFAKALNNGQFQELLSPELRASRNKASGGSGKTNLQAELMQMKDNGVSWGDAAAIIQKNYGMLPGDENSQMLDFVYGGIAPPQTMKAQTKAQVEQAIRDEIATIDDWNEATPEEQAEFIKLNGGDPSSFGL